MISQSTTSTPRRRITKILVEETGGKSYQAHKYNLDGADRPNPEYGDVNKEFECVQILVANHEQVYDDMLVPLFEEETGMKTNLI
jgi:hypothetical protein